MSIEPVEIILLILREVEFDQIFEAFAYLSELCELDRPTSERKSVMQMLIILFFLWGFK